MRTSDAILTGICGSFALGVIIFLTSTISSCDTQNHIRFECDHYGEADLHTDREVAGQIFKCQKVPTSDNQNH